MPASVPSELRLPLAVVAHDAGAANLIAGWIRDVPAARLRVCASGPAARIFAAEIPHLAPLTLPAALDGAEMLLSGTSGAHSDLEHEARRLARTHGVPSIGVIDHWVNYAPRFFRHGEIVLPDEIWVADAHAAALARRTFTDTPVREQPNRYLERLAVQVRAVARPHTERTHVLYALEPMRATWGRGNDAGEFQALDYFREHFPLLGLPRDSAIRLRPHPSDPAGKYDAWLARHADASFALDDAATLAEAIGWADWVVGCESYALAAALAAGRRVASTLPPWAPACRLPHSEIVHLRDLLSAACSPPPALACR